jgi:hypothetical protein
MEPTDQPFIISADRLPHGFVDTTAADRAWFNNMINSDIRYYYRTIRTRQVIPADNPVGKSGITAGELALFIVRENHHKRQRRY